MAATTTSISLPNEDGDRELGFQVTLKTCTKCKRLEPKHFANVCLNCSTESKQPSRKRARVSKTDTVSYEEEDEIVLLEEGSFDLELAQLSPEQLVVYNFEAERLAERQIALPTKLNQAKIDNPVIGAPKKRFRFANPPYSVPCCFECLNQLDQENCVATPLIDPLLHLLLVEDVLHLQTFQLLASRFTPNFVVCSTACDHKLAQRAKTLDVTPAVRIVVDSGVRFSKIGLVSNGSFQERYVSASLKQPKIWKPSCFA